RRNKTRLERNHGGDIFAPVFVRDAYYGGLLNGFVTVEYLFDFARIDIEAAGNNQVFAAVGNIEVAFLIHVAQVAGVHPAVVKDSLGLLLALPIALHDVWTLDHDLADLAGWQLLTRPVIHDHGVDVGQWQANAAVYAVLVQRIAVGHRRGFAQAIALDHLAAAQMLKIILHFRRKGSRAADTEFDRTEQAGFALRLAHDRNIHRGDAGKQGWAIASDGL